MAHLRLGYRTSVQSLQSSGSTSFRKPCAETIASPPHPIFQANPDSLVISSGLGAMRVGGDDHRHTSTVRRAHRMGEFICFPNIAHSVTMQKRRCELVLAIVCCALLVKALFARWHEVSGT